MNTLRRRQPSAIALAIMVMSFTPLATFAQTDSDVSETEVFMEELVVTANRREESLNDVPLSIETFSKEKMDRQSIRVVDDIALLTPGLNFVRGSQFTGTNTQIAIRGIASTVGAATTGVYIDDMPIQARAVGFSTSNTYPRIFDLERIEVLRGPQGALFGAGAEGGAVRFITTKPSLSEYSVYSRAEVGAIDGGGQSYEVGVATGGPIIDDTLGFRVSAWRRNDAGWIDRANPVSGQVVDEDANEQETTALKAALTWVPTDRLTITPSVYHQELDISDTSAYWESLSAPEDGVFKTGYTQAQPVEDTFTVTSLELAYEFDSFDLISVTSQFDRESNEQRDYTSFDLEILGAPPYPLFEGQRATGFLGDEQDIFTQEVRLQSTNDSNLEWVIGAFYSDDDQVATQVNQDSFYEPMLMAFFGLTLEDLGMTYLPGDVIYDSITTSATKQTAVFGQVDYALTDSLTLTLGARYADIEVDHMQILDGIWADGVRTVSSGSSSESSTTPKVGVSYQANDDSLFYGSIAKGFRPGGAQTSVPTTLCGEDLASLGLSGSPDSYDSDSVLSYELGTKQTLWEGRMQFDASAYYIEWDDVQTFVDLPACGSGFIENLGSVTSKGVDLSLQTRVSDRLSFGIVFGYTDASFDETVYGGGNALLVVEGDSALIGPSTTFTLSGQYDFEIVNRPSYVRFDYSYGNEEDTPNPARFGVNPEDSPAPETKMLNMRASVMLGAWELSLFGKNLTNETPGLGRLQVFGGSPLITNTTFTPRTIGITANYRY